MPSKSDITVGKLVEMIEDGELCLPEMQRGYVWKADRVVALLDSLYRGYPSGAILVWETDDDVPTREVAIDQRDYPFKGRKLLLDGQQRLTSLSSVLKGRPIDFGADKKLIEVMFNLDHDNFLGSGTRFEELSEDAENEDGQDDVGDIGACTSGGPAFGKTTQARRLNPVWVDVSSIFTGQSIVLALKAVNGNASDPRFQRFVDRITRVNNIREYTYVMHVLEKSMDYEEVAEIFVRVNSMGVKLRSSDLALAQITSRWRDSLRRFEELREQLSAKYRFPIDIGLIVRTLVVFATGQCRFKLVGGLSNKQIIDAWETTQRCLDQAMGYLCHDVGIDGPPLLSAPFFIIATAYYHYYYPEPTGQEAADFRRWLLFGNARGHFSGSTETKLDADLSKLKEGKGGPAALLDGLREQFGRLEISADDIAKRKPANPMFTAVFMALRAAGARDIRTNKPLRVDPDESGRRLSNWHYLLDPKIGGEEIANIIATAEPWGKKKFLKDMANGEYIRTALAKQGSENLRLHGIPVPTVSVDSAASPEELNGVTASFRDGNRDELLSYRRKHLASLVENFISGAPPDIERRVKAALVQHETATVEFKQEAIDDEGRVRIYIAQTVASFFNSKGGLLLIGVKDDGTLVGIDEDVMRIENGKGGVDGYVRNLSNYIGSQLGKEVSAIVGVAVTTVDGYQICAVSVPEGYKPIFLNQGGRQVLYVRRNNGREPLEGAAAQDYLSHRS